MDKFKKQREVLVAETKRLADELKLTQDSASSQEDRREGSPFGKREEEATETLELEKRLALENRIRQAIEEALVRIEKGTYGICDNCGKPIDPARLEALPQATLCMDCKALQGKNGKVTPSAAK